MNDLNEYTLKLQHCWEKELGSQEITIPDRNWEAKNWQSKSRLRSTTGPRPRPLGFHCFPPKRTREFQSFQWTEERVGGLS